MARPGAITPGPTMKLPPERYPISLLIDPEITLPDPYEISSLEGGLLGLLDPPLDLIDKILKLSMEQINIRDLMSLK
jgi:hypothetical protein